MLTNKGAVTLSKIITEPGLFPEAKKEATGTLLAYYKALLYRDPKASMSAVRRMW